MGLNLLSIIVVEDFGFLEVIDLLKPLYFVVYDVGNTVKTAYNDTGYNDTSLKATNFPGPE